MKALSGFTPIGRTLIVAAAIAILVLFVQAAAEIVAPILLAVFIAIVATPSLRWMRSRGVPKYIALGIVVFVLFDIGSVIALVFTGAIEGLREGLPGYQERLVLLSEQLGQWLESLGIENSGPAVLDFSNPAAITGFLRSILTGISGAVASGLLILLAVAFMLLEAPALPEKINAALQLGPDANARLQRILRAITKYMVIKSMTSLATALLIWFWLWSLGVDFAIFWALLAFAFNFVPFVGVVLMTIPAALMALVQTDLATTLLLVSGYIVVNTVIGSILEPRIMGRGLGISTLAVFLSLLFWGWVLGTTGVFLSVPLTIALVIALDADPRTRAFAILLGPRIADAGTAAGHGPGPEGHGAAPPDPRLP